MMEVEILQIYLEQMSQAIEKNMNAIQHRPARVVALLFLFHRAELFAKAIIKLSAQHQLATCVLLRSIFEIVIQTQYISLFDAIDNKVAEQYLRHESMEKFRNLLCFSEFYETEAFSETLNMVIIHYENKRDDILHIINKPEIREKVEEKISELKNKTKYGQFKDATKCAEILLELTKQYQKWGGLTFEKMKNKVLEYYQNNPSDSIFDPLNLRLLSKVSYSVFGNISTHATSRMNNNFFDSEKWIFDSTLDLNASSEIYQTLLTFRLLQQALFRVGILPSDKNNQLDLLFNEFTKNLSV